MKSTQGFGIYNACTHTSSYKMITELLFDLKVNIFKHFYGIEYTNLAIMKYSHLLKDCVLVLVIHDIHVSHNGALLIYVLI